MPILNEKEFNEHFVVFRRLGPDEKDGIHVSIESREKLEGTPDTDLVVSLEEVRNNPSRKVYID